MTYDNREKNMRSNIYASLPDASSTAKVVGALLDHGVKSEDISALLKSIPEVYGAEHDVFVQAESGITTTTTGDAKAGAAKGAGIGLGLGAIAALAALVVPGIGVVLGGGALAVAAAGLVGATAAGAMAGAVSGFMIDQGVEPELVSGFTQTVEAGGSIVSVSVPSGGVNHDEIVSILEKYGGTVRRVTPPNLPQGPGLNEGVPATGYQSYR
ncbi:MAG: hypothetical protein JNM34_02295 [Chthonomonadaceae bacterium]|nr:hypothetical protein [Chthonomonadaceae bacterium]